MVGGFDCGGGMVGWWPFFCYCDRGKAKSIPKSCDLSFVFYNGRKGLHI